MKRWPERILVGTTGDPPEVPIRFEPSALLQEGLTWWIAKVQHYNKCLFVTDGKTFQVYFQCTYESGQFQRSLFSADLARRAFPEQLMELML